MMATPVKAAGGAGTAKPPRTPAAPKHVFTTEQVADFKEVFLEVDTVGAAQRAPSRRVGSRTKRRSRYCRCNVFSPCTPRLATRAFALAFAQDGSGSIDRNELRVVISKCGIEVSDAQLGELLKDADEDKSGAIEVRRATRALSVALYFLPPADPIAEAPPLPCLRPSAQFVEFLNLMHKLQSGPNERELKNEMFLVRGNSLITPGLPGQLLLRRRPPPPSPCRRSTTIWTAS